MPNILVIGSSNTDMVVKTERFPQAGETILGGEFFMFPGGKGANQAVAAARLGGKVTFICKVGQDVFGEQAIEGFKKEGIATNFCLTTKAAASGVALITVNAEGENEIVVASGANNQLTEADLDAAEAAFAAADLLLIQLETPIPTVEYAITKGAQMGKKVILNPAPAQNISQETYQHLFLITPNETEAELLTGIKVEDDATAAQAADALLAKGVQHVILTLGAKGAYYKSATQELHVPAQKVKAIDTTAAGDVFNGALTVALAEGEDWLAAIQFAAKAAAISVTRMGAQASAPLRSDL
ncbi:MAG: ribokinase [Saprospiraceae bacterium]|nr:ribokinase [Saprospiraceae bacterium]